MKNYLLALFLCTTVFVFAQNNSYGVRVGANLSNLELDPEPMLENDYRYGMFFAGFVDWNISDKISILTELQYSAEGSKQEELRADYLQLPVLFRLHLGNKLTLGVGPMVSLKTWGFEDDFAPFTASGVGGIEYMFTREFFLDVRVHYGLTNIYDESTFEAQNSAIQVGIGMKI